jgi:hypothetical protein
MDCFFSECDTLVNDLKIDFLDMWTALKHEWDLFCGGSFIVGEWRPQPVDSILHDYVYDLEEYVDVDINKHSQDSTDPLLATMV